MAKQSKSVAPRKPSGRRRAVPGEQFLTTRADSPFWWFDFAVDGARFRGSCGTADHDQAAAFAQAEQDREFKRIRLGIEPPRSLTLNDAFVRYWREVAEGTSYGEGAQKHQMARMRTVLGKDLPLSSLSDARVSDLVNALRFPKDDRKPVGPATINRHLTTLSAICKRAREVWGAEVGPWARKRHLQTEPEGRERFLTREQAKAVLLAAVPHMRIALLRHGLTRAEIEDLEKGAWFCTLERATHVVNLPPTEKMVRAGFTKPKPPKLSECMKHFFGEELDGAHDALVDVRACARIYFALQQKEQAA